MELIETILTAFIGSLFGAILTVFIGYMTFSVKLESRLNDLGHKIGLLEPFKDILYQASILMFNTCSPSSVTAKWVVCASFE
ncbi:MAG: hypothetical protein CHKLHMKO_00492 [Candidatus Argoarchaeum ethanivorans]|uniref:Uncharacterized protein n=1 Tax=Candidatus Argoarchaeum ethanivorans TaxID=2608793 RepID=A0A811TB19_9EURY|nr:MAG: hypothetical protein CHKLHMKO_00492 [Candidatus Argoarchaeum ethanivorans]